LCSFSSSSELSISLARSTSPISFAIAPIPPCAVAFVRADRS
jgi:hypothetical protein